MTNEQREVLAHIVIDPDAWYVNAVAVLGQEKADAALIAKVGRWAPERARDIDRDGPQYKTRAAREAQRAPHLRALPADELPQ